MGYRIYYNVLDCAKAELADCNENTTFVDEVTVPDLVHTISNLKNYTEYEIQIELFNSLATGPKSPKIIIYTDEDGKILLDDYFDNHSLKSTKVYMTEISNLV